MVSSEEPAEAGEPRDARATRTDRQTDHAVRKTHLSRANLGDGEGQGVRVDHDTGTPRRAAGARVIPLRRPATVGVRRPATVEADHSTTLATQQPQQSQPAATQQPRTRQAPTPPPAQSPAPATAPTPAAPPAKEPLWRDVVGDVLRRERLAQERTLKNVSDAARISMPYLSELERGRKEASSEVLAAAAHALGLSLTDLLARGHDEIIRLSGAEPLGARAALSANTLSTGPLAGAAGRSRSRRTRATSRAHQSQLRLAA